MNAMETLLTNVLKQVLPPHIIDLLNDQEKQAAIVMRVKSEYENRVRQQDQIVSTLLTVAQNQVALFNAFQEMKLAYEAQQVPSMAERLLTGQGLIQDAEEAPEAEVIDEATGFALGDQPRVSWPGIDHDEPQGMERAILEEALEHA